MRGKPGYRPPWFAPRPSPRSSSKPSAVRLPNQVTSLLDSVRYVIENRPRLDPEAGKRSWREINWWRMRDHRAPTRWVLYRELLRRGRRVEESNWGRGITGEAKGKGKAREQDDTAVEVVVAPARSLREVGVLGRWIRAEFEARRGITALGEGQEALRQGYIWLDRLSRSLEKDDPQARQEVCAHLKELTDRQEREGWASAQKKALDESAAARRVIMTGAFLRPSVNNRPLPRYVPQPLRIGMMIAHREKRRQRRVDEVEELKTLKKSVALEEEFERSLKSNASGSLGLRDFRNHIANRQKAITESFKLDDLRRTSQYTPAQLEAIHRARRRRPVVLAAKKRDARMRRRLGEVRRAAGDVEDIDVEDGEREGAQRGAVGAGR